MNLTIHTDATAPTGSRELLDGIRADLGLVPNMAAAIATSPVLLAAFDALRRTVGSGTLDPVHREIAGLAVGVAVDNAYGVAFHSTVLAGLGVSDSEIETIRSGGTSSDARCAAVQELAREVVLTRGKVDGATVERAAAAGFSPADILEVVAECTFAGLVGVVDNLAGRVALDSFLAPRAWDGAAAASTPTPTS